MNTGSHYIMRDQARGIAPELTRFDASGRRRDKGSFRELLLFTGAVVLYLAALGISN